MAKVTYTPTDEMPSKTSQFGFDFDAGKSVDVPAGKALDKFRGNAFFDVAEDTKASPEKAGNGLEAVHRGRGVYAVVWNGVVLDQLDPMNKADADAFNAMSDEDKAAFVDKPAAPPAPPEPAAPKSESVVE